MKKIKWKTDEGYVGMSDKALFLLKHLFSGSICLLLITMIS